MNHERMTRLFFDRFFPLVVNNKGYVVYIAKEYAATLKKNPEDIIGRYVKDVIPDTRLISVLDSEQELFGELFKIETGQIVICDYILLRGEDGSVEGACVISPYFINATYAQDFRSIEKLYKQVAQLKMEKARYKQEMSEMEHLNSKLVDLVGEAPAIVQLRETIKRIIDTDIAVLITGETGVGKEVVSSAIHQWSKRKNQKFVKINCAAIPGELLESELFGYEPGSFSGALKTGKLGKFEFANHGTILLDEIGEMPLALQGKLLRTLQDKEIVRVGGLNPIKLNVKVVCSTNSELEQKVKAGLFRSDLYYRINVVNLHVPPLRERKEDIRLLCEALIKRINHYHSTGVKGITADALKLFTEYDWPGNVRELEHVLERACVMTNDDYLGEDSFDLMKFRLAADRTSQNTVEKRDMLAGKKTSFEKNEVLSALKEAKGNKSLAAKNLGIARQTLYKKIEKLGIVETGTYLYE